MNEKFASPICEVVLFENEDVITISLGGDDVVLPENKNGAGE
jgi:hypothetical protein